MAAFRESLRRWGGRVASWATVARSSKASRASMIQTKTLRGLVMSKVRAGAWPAAEERGTQGIGSAPSAEGVGQVASEAVYLRGGVFIMQPRRGDGEGDRAGADRLCHGVPPIHAMRQRRAAASPASTDGR